MTEPRRSSSPPVDLISRVTTYLVTNGTKVIGLWITFREAALPGAADKAVLIAGVALAMGAQTVENIALKVIERFFGGEDQSK